MDLSCTNILSRCKRLVLGLLLLLPILPAALAQTLGPDVQSGFFAGNIAVVEGAGTNMNSGMPALTTQYVAGLVAVDSQGNIFLSYPNTNGNSTVAAIYSGATPVSPLIAAVEPNPVAGNIYFPVIGGAAASEPTAGDGLPATSAYFENILSLAFDANDNLYIADGPGSGADLFGSVVRRVDHATTIVTTIAGQEGIPSASSFLGDNGPALSATLNYPTDARADSAGNIYIVDSGDDVVRVVYGGGAVPAILTAEGVTPTAQDKGFIYTVAGQAQVSCPGPASCFANNTSAISGSFGDPESVAVDSAGNLYVVDFIANVVDVIYAGGTVPILGSVTASPTPGNLYTVAGTQFTACTTAPCGDGAAALSAAFGLAYYITIDNTGNLYVADTDANTVRKVDTTGYISTVAGVENPFPATPAPIGAENGPATSVYFNGVPSFAFDAQNNLYVIDSDGDFQDSHNLVWKAVAAQPQTITFDGISVVTYGVGPITLDASASSGLPVTYTVASGPATVSGSTLLVTGGGTVVITASQAGGTQTTNGTSVYYAAAADVQQKLIVNPEQLTIAAIAATKLYGQPNPAFAATITGFVSPDNQQSVFTGSPAITTTAGTKSDVGTYPLTVTRGSLAFTSGYQADYTLAFVPGTLTITGASKQTITFGALAPITYGAATTIALTGIVSSGLPLTYTITSGTAASVAGSTVTILGGGTVTIAASQAGNNNYSGAPTVSQTLVINPAPLTVTAPSFSLPIGSAITSASFPAPTITGFVGSDTQASVNGIPVYTTTATAVSAAGTYPIVATLGTLQVAPALAANYTFAGFAPGTLTINLNSQTVTFNKLNNEAYGNLAGALPPTALASSGLPVTYTISGPANFFNDACPDPITGALIFPAPPYTTYTCISSPAINTLGVGQVTITATQPGNAQYAAAAPASQTITITPARLDITATSYTREYGAPNPTFAYQIGNTNPGVIGGFVGSDSDVPSVISGVPVLATIASQLSTPGTYAINVAAGTLSAANYYFNFVPGTLTVLPAGGYTITSSPGSLTIPAGQSRQATITISSTNLYQGTVTLSCGSLPANVTCIFSPSTYTFTGANNISQGIAYSVQGTLTVNTAGSQTVVGSLSSPSTPLQRGSILLIPGGLGGLLLLRRRRPLAKTNSFWQMCLLAALSIGALGLNACGTSKTNSAANAAVGTSTIIIQGAGTDTSGSSVTSSMNLSITIQ